jgi:hypothetical protein
MYYSVSVDRNSMAATPHQKRLQKVLRSAVRPIQWMVLICCGMVVNGMGMLEVSVGKMRALTVKVETVTLVDKGR